MRSAFPRILAAVLLLPQITFTQPSIQSRTARVESGLLPPILIKGEPGWSIHERMKHHKVPGVSIAVINNFKIEWAKAYGVKDVDTGEPVTTETLFQAGSISKPVAAMTALKKVEEGKVSLDENINNKLTSWRLPENDLTRKKAVTLANLLSHTAGLTVHGFPGYAVGSVLPTIPQVLDGVAPANTAAVRVDLEPGTRFRYSGGGTTIAQLALMDIEKKSFPQIARETVLGPLQMTDSTYEQPLPPKVRPKAASGHRMNGSLIEGKIHIYPEMAAAGLWTTPTDLAKFAIEVQLSLEGRSNRVLSKETIVKMTSPFIDGNVGLGFFIERKGKATYFGHGGADEGFRAELLVHKEKGFGAVVMVNSDNGRIIREIIRGIAKEYGWEDFLPEPLETVAVYQKKLDDYTGRYLIGPDRVLSVTRENERLHAQPTASPRVSLFALSETAFVRNDADIRYTFVRDAAGKCVKVKVRVGEQEFEAPRISDDKAIPYDLLMTGKAAEASAAYRKIKREQPDNEAVAENRLNDLGYSLLAAKKYRDAIEIFRLNVELYPLSSNVFDSLGEAYMLKGDKEQAIANYKKSLELNPSNKNAVKMLNKLQGT